MSRSSNEHESQRSCARSKYHFSTELSYANPKKDYGETFKANIEEIRDKFDLSQQDFKYALDVSEEVVNLLNSKNMSLAHTALAFEFIKLSINRTVHATIDETKLT